jgi:hypothetical protein
MQILKKSPGISNQKILVRQSLCLKPQLLAIVFEKLFEEHSCEDGEDGRSFAKLIS